MYRRAAGFLPGKSWKSFAFFQVWLWPFLVCVLAHTHVLAFQLAYRMGVVADVGAGGRP